jgi:biopolymer transport protein ExbB/TolQ
MSKEQKDQKKKTNKAIKLEEESHHIFEQRLEKEKEKEKENDKRKEELMKKMREQEQNRSRWIETTNENLKNIGKPLFE